MSRIGKQAIDIPEGVNVSLDKRLITVKGPKGELSLVFRPEVDVVLEDEKQIVVKKKGQGKLSHALWGTTRALIANLIQGVTVGFTKVLELHGVGYKMALQGKKLVLHLGFSHPVEVEVPDGLTVEIEQEKMKISGIDKQVVGQFAADIRALRKVEPYKGKGFRYENEQFIRKEGKKAVGSE